MLYIGLRAFIIFMIYFNIIFFYLISSITDYKYFSYLKIIFCWFLRYFIVIQMYYVLKVKNNITYDLKYLLLSIIIIIYY